MFELVAYSVDKPSVRVFTTVWGVVMLALAGRMWRLGVRVVADGVKISNYLYTKHVAWRTSTGSS